MLRKTIAGGEKPDVFASANMAHPEKLAANGWGTPVVLFARNKLCAIAQPEVNLATENMLKTLLRKDIRVGTSTPKADPSGDYAWKLFRRAAKDTPGLKIIPIPEELSVGADYDLLIRIDAPTEAWQLAMYILSPAGQKILKDYGLEASAIKETE